MMGCTLSNNGFEGKLAAVMAGSIVHCPAAAAPRSFMREQDAINKRTGLKGYESTSSHSYP